MTTRLAPAIAVLAAVAVLGGCSSSAREASPSVSAPSTSGVGETEATPASEALDWMLTRGTNATLEEITERFTPTFLAAVSATEVQAAFGQLADATVLERSSLTSTRATARVEVGDGTMLDVVVMVDASEPHRVESVSFESADAPNPLPTTWEEIDRRAGATIGDVSIYAVRSSSSGERSVVYARRETDIIPLASVFKLWVLVAVAEAIQHGDMSWSEELTVRDALKSIPSGELQNEPDGTRVTVLHAAQLMISISDNTATDLLIARVGRAGVEEVVRRFSSSEAQRLTLPLLTTRQLTLLKWGVDAAFGDRYVAGDTAQRAVLLDQLPALTDEVLARVVGEDAPQHVDRIEWFSTPADMMRVYEYLADLAVDTLLAPLSRILSFGDGDPKLSWAVSAWFKGGDEPGVFTLTFRFVDENDVASYLIVSARSTTALLDDNELDALASGATDLLGAAT